VPKRSVVSVGATLLVASMALSACGSRGETGATTSGGEGAKIGVIAPLSGNLSALGLGIKNSVDLAIKQANESNAIPGWKFEILAAGRRGQG
jgi:branched-chain amino acid transport system substrate-binding protein